MLGTAVHSVYLEAEPRLVVLETHILTIIVNTEDECAERFGLMHALYFKRSGIF